MIRHKQPFFRRVLGIGTVLVVASLAISGCASSGGQGDGKVTISFSQWWEPEMPKGALLSIMHDFEKKNPDITVKLLSQPYASVQTQMTSASAAGNLPDVVGLDGAWVNALYKQGALENLSTLLKGYDQTQLRDKVNYDGSTYMIPLVNFAYPLFTNDAILAKAGISKPPATWSEFYDDAVKIKALGGNISPTVMPLGTTDNSGARDIMSWVWTSGGSMLKAGSPELTDNSTVTGATNLWRKLIKNDLVLPGYATMQEGDKLSNFANGRIGMMVNGLTIVDTLKQDTPDLKFTVSQQPTMDDYTGTPGMLYASWGLGVSKGSQHKAAAAKLVKYLLSPSVNSAMSTDANGFPGVKNAEPKFSSSTDPHVVAAYDVYKNDKPVNEFVGLPAASQLQNDFVVEFQKALQNKESTSSLLSNVQTKWKMRF
jgi:multiple sugar transport system substrate-binding protein